MYRKSPAQRRAGRGTSKNVGSESPRAKCPGSSDGDLLNAEETPAAVPIAAPADEAKAALGTAPAEVHDEAAAARLRVRTEAGDGVV
jgi:hypothetical protein